MKRTHALRLGLVSVVAGASIAGVAWAASSPTVRTGAATKISDTGALLHGVVNPNGSRTAYAFSFGPTTAYGASTPVRSAGGRAKAVAVSAAIGGLTPGTVYHYHLAAVNAVGTSTGADRTFKTAGHPPAAVVTGGTVNVGKTFATPTGTINPEGESTTWEIQYGLTTGYGFQSIPQTLGAGSQPVPVSVQLTGLAPGTLFHYRVVAYHGSKFASAGGDGVFFTEPSQRPKPRLHARTRPGRDRRSPYQFTTSGLLGGAASIPAPWRCAGTVGIRYFNGGHQLAVVVVPVGPDCRFSAPASFRRLHGPRPAHLRIFVYYRGTGYVAPAKRIDHVIAG